MISGNYLWPLGQLININIRDALIRKYLKACKGRNKCPESPRINQLNTITERFYFLAEDRANRARPKVRGGQVLRRSEAPCNQIQQTGGRTFKAHLQKESFQSLQMS